MSITITILHISAFSLGRKAKKGKKKHGKAAEAALMKEFAQLEELNAYESINPATLTRKQKMEEL